MTLLRAFQGIYSSENQKSFPTMVDVKNIQLFLGPLLVNECPCIKKKTTSHCVHKMLQNIMSTKCRKTGGLRNYHREGNFEKGEVNF